MVDRLNIVSAVLVTLRVSMPLAGQTPPATFRVATVEFTMPLPSGLCVAAGPGAAVAQLIAATDEVNLTTLTLLPCADQSGAAPDYVLVKAPKAALLAVISRDALLTELAKTFEAKSFADESAKGNDEIEKSFAKLLGEHPEIVGAVKPLGRDDVCAYLGGVLTFTGKSLNYSRAVSACITSVGGKVITVYRYSDGATPANVLRHLPTAKALALSITPVVKAP